MKQFRFYSFSAGCFLTLLFAAGCGPSPLFHHKDEKPPQLNFIPQLNEKTCPMYFQSENLCASVEPLKLQSENHGGQFSLKFWKKSDSANVIYILPEKPVEADLWMSSNGMSHGGPEITVIKQATSFLLDNLIFIMRGKWAMRVRLGQGQDMEQKEIFYEY